MKTDDKIAAPLDICVFAHNEERRLPRCLGALDAAAGGLPYAAHIMVNGSRDESERIARRAADANPSLSVHILSVADKANAWNHFMARLARDRTTLVFVDGDVAPTQGAFAALAGALANNRRALAAAALPASGRSRRRWRERLTREHYLSGNLYALSGAARRAWIASGLALPFGAKGEDGLLSYLLLTDLMGGPDNGARERIVICPDAEFTFRPLGLGRGDMRTFHRRCRRYSERHFQKTLLYPLLKAQGASALPGRIASLYTREALAQLRPRLHPLHYFYDRATLRALAKNAG